MQTHGQFGRMDIVPALPGQVSELQQLMFVTWLATYRNAVITREDIEAYFKTPDIVEKIFSWCRRPSTLLARDGGAIVGMCRCITRPREGGGRENWIRAMYVLPSYQGRGIGRALWEHASQLKEFDQNVPTFLQVATYTEPAITFYGKLGFERAPAPRSVLRLPTGKTIPRMEMVRYP